MDILFQISALIGIAPAFVVLYYFWKKFENFFPERLLFFNLVMGFIIGTFIAAIFLISAYSSHFYIDLSIIFLIVFAMFTELLKFLWLNRKSYRDSYKVTYLGFAFGLGFGSMFAIALTYYYEKSYFDYISILYFVFLSFGFSFVHSTTGSLIGFGIYTNTRLANLFNAILIMILFNLTLLPYVWNFPPYFSLLSFLVGLFVFYFVAYQKILVDTLPQKERKMWRKFIYENR